MVNESISNFTIYYFHQGSMAELKVVGDREDLTDDEILDLAFKAGLPEKDVLIIGIAPWIE